MKFLLLALTVCVALADKLDLGVLSLAGLKGGKTDIMINMAQQQTFDGILKNLDDMGWEKRGQFVMNVLMNQAEETQRELREYLKKNGIQFKTFWIQNTIAAFQVPEHIIIELSQRKDVKKIFSGETLTQDIPEPIHTEKLGPSNTPEWSLDWIEATNLWKLGFKGNGTVVGGADTGIQFDHPSLVHNYRGNLNNGNFDHNYNWADGVTNETFPRCNSPCGCSLKRPCDDQGHGTHTLATAVGGKDRVIGVSPDSKWIGCRGFSDMGRHWRSSTFITCLQFFLAPTNLDGKNPQPNLRPHATIHSYGCNSFLGCPNHDDMEPSAKALRAAGVLMSVAAQNAGSACGTVNRQPAHYESIVSVGALGVRTNLIAGFSSRGPVKIDGSNRRKPDLVAPGTNILSANIRSTYSQMSGTSMAAPHVAGAFALFWSAVPRLKGRITETLNIFEKTAAHQRTRDCESTQETPNNVYGYGTIQIEKAYKEAIKLGWGN